MVTKLPHADDEYDECLQRTPELERRQQSCVACRFLLEVSYHTSTIIATEHVTHKKQANHDGDNDIQKTEEAEAAAAAAAAVVAARAPSPQANERRMTKETSGNGYRCK